MNHKPLLLVATLFVGQHLFAQDKNSLLDQAFWKNNPSIDQIKEEIAKGNNPLGDTTAGGFDPATTAILAGAPTEDVKFLLEQKGINVNRGTHDARTYVFWAAMKGDITLIDYLAKRGALFNLEDSHGATPLSFIAGRQTDPKIYDVLISYGADIHKKYKDGANLLLTVIPNDKDLKLTDYLISKGLSLNSTDDFGNTAFNYAAKTGNIDNLKELLKRGVKYTDNALIMASEGSFRSANKLDVYEYLIGLGIKPTVKGSNGENVLHNIAKKDGQSDIIQYFISKGVDVNQQDKDGNTPFINAAGSDKNVSDIELLLTKVKNINLKNKSGESALALAVKGNTSEVVTLLLNKGADANTKDAAGNGLPYYLVQSVRGRRGGGLGGPQAGGRGQGGPTERKDDFAEKLQLLQSKNVNFAAAQGGGNTLYHLALAKNDLNLLKKVSNLGININAKNDEGLTVLQKAALTAKDDSILQYLVTLSADKKITTDMDETAYDLAKDNKYLKGNNVSIEFLK